jgi:DNA-binding Lrp family transcriptional regulator
MRGIESTLLDFSRFDEIIAVKNDLVHMPSAIVLANSEIGKESEIIDVLAKFKEIEETYLVYGVYDIVMRVNSETMEDLETIITQKIRMIPSIRSTLTLIVSRLGK